MGRDSCLHSPGMSRVGEYPKLARYDVNLLFSMRPACFKTGINFRISIYTHLLGETILLRLYLLIISLGILEM